MPLYVNPYDVNEIKEAIIKILDDDQLKIKLINSGITQSNKYSWEDSANKLKRIIDSILNNHISPS